MDFNIIRKDMKMYNFETLRTDCDNFFEGVVIGEEVGKLSASLKNFFGEPVYPSKEKLTHKVRQKVDGAGGLMPGQTLYYKDEGSESTMAMLWPWKDGRRTTVKIIQQ